MRILAKEEAKFIDQWAVEKGGLPLGGINGKWPVVVWRKHCGSI